MSVHLKHKIFALVLTFAATSAFGAIRMPSSLQAGVTADCYDCSFGRIASGPLAKNQMLKPISLFSADGKDPRRILARTGKNAMFSPIGVVDTINEVSMMVGNHRETGNLQSTGFLISPCLVMTTYHSVFGDGVPTSTPGSPRDFSKYAVKFSVGGTPSGTGFSEKEILATPVAFGRPTKENNYSSDWAILQLPKGRCVGSNPDIGWFDFLQSSDEELQNDQVMTAGYPSDLESSDFSIDKKKLFQQSTCRIYNAQINKDNLNTDCAHRSGGSGAPVIRMVGGFPKVVGMMTTSFDIIEVQKTFKLEYASQLISVTTIESEAKLLYGTGIVKPVQVDTRNNAPQEFHRPQMPEA